MSTQAQKARNARKRAKLKAHRKSKMQYLEKPVVGRFLVTCRLECLWYNWSYTIETDAVPNWNGDFNFDLYTNAVALAWADEIISKLTNFASVKVVPGSIRLVNAMWWPEDSHGGERSIIWSYKNELSDFLNQMLAAKQSL